MEIHLDSTVILGILTLGIILLLVGLVGKVKAKEIEVGTNNKLARAIIGILGFGLTILAVYAIIYEGGFITIKPTPAPHFPPTATATLAPTVPPTAAAALVPTTEANTATPGMSITNFQACLDPCTGSNAIDTFPEKTTRIYLQWSYQNIPAHATYKRTVTLGSRVWATYTTNWDECAFPSTSSTAPGIETHTFTEPDGIASGVWTISVEINGEVLLQKNLTVLGSWTYFAPAGTFVHCTGLH